MAGCNKFASAVRDADVVPVDAAIVVVAGEMVVVPEVSVGSVPMENPTCVSL